MRGAERTPGAAGDRTIASSDARSGVIALLIPGVAPGVACTGLGCGTGRAACGGRVCGGRVPALDRSTGKRAVVDIFETVVVLFAITGLVGTLMDAR